MTKLLRSWYVEFELENGLKHYVYLDAERVLFEDEFKVQADHVCIKFPDKIHCVGLTGSSMLVNL